MFLSWWRNLVTRTDDPRRTTRPPRRRPQPSRWRRQLNLEMLEDRLAPAATLSMPGTFSAVQNGMLSVPVKISALTDGSKVGLSAATIAITWTPTSGTTADLEFVQSRITTTLGDIPSSNGASNWTITTSSPADGRLNVNLSATVGHTITTNTFPSGGTLFTVNLPVTAGAPTGTINFSILSNSSGVHTSIVGSGTYTLSTVSTGVYATATATISPGMNLAPMANPVAFTTSSNQTLTVSAPGILMNSSDPNTPVEPLSVASINGSAADVGSAVALPSGAMLTVHSDGSFTYVPATDFAGNDSFSFTVGNTGGSVSPAVTATIAVTPTLHLSPSAPTGAPGSTFTESVILDNPNPAGSGGMNAFSLALTYTAGALTVTNISRGPDVPSGWTVTTNSGTAGQIAIGAFDGTGTLTVTGPTPIVLATITFQIGMVSPTTVPLQLVPMFPSGSGTTSITGTSGSFTLSPVPSTSFQNGVDANIMIVASLLNITPSSPPPSDVNVLYNQTFVPSGGTAPYTFTLKSGTLPTGMTLSSGGVLNGTPTVAGTYSFTMTLADSASHSSDFPLSLVINPNVAITTTTLANWTTSKSGYGQTINATGGTGALTYTLSTGTLPPGLGLSSSGVLSGTPTTAGTYTFSVAAHDSLGSNDGKSYTVTINPAVAITTTSLGNWTANKSGYSQTISATGGTGALTFSAPAASLPTGLTLSSGGVLSGTPAVNGSFSFTVTATDGVGATGTQNYTVVINQAVSITTGSLPNWTAGKSGYSQTISATGGTGALTFSSTGTLPVGLTLSTGGVLSGTPTTAGSFNFMVTATDTLGAAGSQSYTLTINPAVSVTTTALPNWTAGFAGYSQTVSATGGTGSKAFATSSGTLPTGLTLSSAGVLTGTPSAAGSFTFGITATDSVGATGSMSYTVVINPAVTITTTMLTSASISQPYSQTIPTTGGTGALTFTQTGGTLPPGLTLSSAGVVSGTPTTLNTYSFTVKATDTLGANATQTITLSVLSLGVTPTTLPNWTVSRPGYSQTLGAFGGTGPFTFAFTGTLPTGMTLTTGGVLSGTPTTAGSYNFTVTVTDTAGGGMASQPYTVVINPVVAITTTSLANWTDNQAGYSQTIATTGGTAPLNFTLASGTLPTGLTLSSGGVLSGKPTAAGSYTFSVTAGDVAMSTASQSYTVVINPAVTITTTSLPNWTVSQSGYNQTLNVTGGTGAKSFATTSGTVPTGLTLSAGGVLSGTPTAAGSFSFTVTATDGVGATATQNYTVVVNPAVTITTTSLPNWTDGHAGYSQTLAVTGGTGAKTFAVTGGTLPTGLALTGGGVLSGTPTASGTFMFTVTATDTIGAAGGEGYTVTVNPAVTITTTTLPNWTVSQSGYDQTIAVTGGTGAKTFATTTGTVPTGMTLSPAGVLSGTPTAAGSYSFTVTTTDTVGATGTQPFTVVINPAVSITTTSLPSWTVSTAYSQTIAATGGTGGKTFTTTSGTVPTGLTLSSAGVLSGTPTATGSFSFTVTATDTTGASTSQAYSVTINPTVVITTTSLPNAAVSQPGYNQTITATGGTGALIFSAPAASLPTGLTLSSSGVLSGTPTATGSFTFTVTATDSVGATGTHSYTILISSFSITPATLPNWTVNQAGYSQTLGTTGGGTAPFTFSSSGTLPTGLTLSTSGVLSGKPTATGSFTFTINVVDSTSAPATQSFTVVINPAVSITTTTLANWTDSFPGYSQTITATGGTGAKTFSTTLGTVPAGLTLSSGGVLSGTPTSVGTFTFTVTATDTVGAAASQSYTVVINPEVVITTTTLPSWTVSQSGYGQTINATGGTGAKTFTATTGTLPSGLTLSAAGVLSGTPTATGTYTFTVTATDMVNATGSQSYTVVINPAVTITTTTLPSWTVSQAGYSQTIGVTGGTGSKTLAIASGTVPTGMTLSSAGVLSGTPTAAGSYTFSIKATDTVGASATQSFTVVINPGVSITTTSLPNWTISQAGYSQTLGVTGGTGTKTFATTSGTVPTGLTLSASGVLSGTPTAAGSFSFTVTATDTTGATGSQSYTVVINPAVTITTTTLPSWTVSLTGYSQTLSATGGTGAKTFATSSGTLPAGLTLSGAGVLSGTPTVAGTFNFTVTATDTVNATGSQSYTVVINPAVAITTTALSAWTLSHAGYSQTIDATGGTGVKTFTTTTGTLPAGLTLSSAGVLSGTPTSAGSFSFTVKATDTVGGSASQSYTITINPAVSITTTTLANWTVSQAGYSQTITATGGTGSRTFSGTAGTLPTGLTLSSTGVLSGTPSAAGSFNFTVTATDSVGATGSQTYTVVINPAVTLPASLPADTQGVNYNQTITASGGTGNKTLAVTGITGAIPGLTVPTTGTNSIVISGVPTATGTMTFKVTATDTIGATTMTTYTIVVNPVLSIAPTTLPATTAGTTYTQTITVSGGTTPYATLSVSSFNAGGTGLTASEITPDTATGTFMINGVPTGPGTATFTLNVTDAAGGTLSQAYSVLVHPAPPTHFVITATSPQAANGFFTFTVMAEDVLNLVVPSYSGTVHFSSTDLAAVLPMDSALTAGVGSFTATLKTLGIQTITARDTSISTLTGTSGNINVINPTLVVVSPTFTGAPGSSVAGGHLIGFDAFATIAQGVNVVAAGGTVQVLTGNYHESVTLAKSLTLQGAGAGSAFVTGAGSSGVGLNVSGANVNVSGLTVQGFAAGLTAGSSTKSLALSDVMLTGNTAGGTITGVSAVSFTGNGTNETLTATTTQFGRSGDNLISYSGVGTLTLDGSGGNNTLDLSGAAGQLGVFLSGKGGLSGFAGNTTLPGVIFTNVNILAGNNVAGDFLVGTSAAATWSLGAGTSQYVSGGQTLSFTGLNTVYGGGAADAFTVNSAGTGGLTVNGQGGGDSFTVNLGALAGPVSLYDVGGSGTNTAMINGTSANDSMTVYSTAVTWNNQETVSYAGLQGLTVNSGSGSDAIAVQSDAVGTATTVSGTGADTFIVSSAAGLLDTIVSPLTLNGGSGANYLYVSEANRPSADTLYLTNNAIISGTGSFAPISYTANGGTYHGTAILVAGNGNNVVRVFSTAAGTGYGLYTGNGNSDIIVSSPTNTLDTMAGAIDLVAGSGTNLLYVSEAGNTSPDTMSLNSTYISTTSGLFMTFTAPGGNFGAGVFLVTGSANNNVRIFGTAAGSINGIELGNGNNTVVVTSAAGTLDTMAGKIGVQGGTGTNLLYVSDAGSTRPDQLFVSGVAVQGAGLFLSYAASPGGTFGRGVDVVGSNAGTQMYVVGQLAGSPIGLFGGSGNDLFNIYVTAITFYNLSVNGEGGSDFLHLFDLTGGGIEQVSPAGPNSGQVTFTYTNGFPNIVLFYNLTLA
jgi:hypothetical protein